MPRTLQWPLIAVWLTIGVIAGIALSDPFTNLALLLVPVGLVTAWLLWNAGLARETGAMLIGFITYPVLLLLQAQDPACPAGGEFAACEPGALAPWLAVVALLMLSGSGVLVFPHWREESTARPTGR